MRTWSVERAIDDALARVRVLGAILSGPGHDYDTPVVDDTDGMVKVPPPEPPLSDDELVAVRQLIEERFGDRDACAEDEAAEDYLFTTAWDEHDAQNAETQRAEGLQHAHTPGEVSGDLPASPSPGGLHELADSELLMRAADVIDDCAKHTPKVLQIMSLLELAETLRDRGNQFAAFEAESDAPVGHEDLAAHITADLQSLTHPLALLSHRPSSTEAGDVVARDLLRDFRITKK